MELTSPFITVMMIGANTGMVAKHDDRIQFILDLMSQCSLRPATVVETEELLSNPHVHPGCDVICLEKRNLLTGFRARPYGTHKKVWLKPEEVTGKRQWFAVMPTN